MPDERPIDAPIEEKLELLKKDFYEYIGKNSEKVDANLPVFYGYVISSLDPFLKEISETAYDDFIDAITFKLLDESKNTQDTDFVDKVCENALRSKRRGSLRTGVDVAAGTKLLKLGSYPQAIKYLSRYTHLDAIIATSVAYCNYMLSLQEIADQRNQGVSRPGETELLAREQMLTLAQKSPPINVFPQLQPPNEPGLTRAFWLMISCALDWFPSERRFLYIGLEKAKRDGNKEMRKELLKIAIERFFDDMVFLREAYLIRIEERDAIGAAGIVKQMMQQFPDDLEPIYYGIRLSLLTSTKTTYETFRRLSIAKGMSPQMIQLLDLGIALMTRDKQSAFLLLKEMKRRPGNMQHYTTSLEYIAQDLFIDDEKRARRAKKVILESLDQYCTRQLQGESRTAA
jgi:hypothetical protein